MEDRPANRIACLCERVKRKLRSVPAEVTACLGDFPPAMMVPHESRRNAWSRARRRIFLRPQSLRYRRNAGATPALRRAPSAAWFAGSFSSLGAGDRNRALSAGILRGQNPLLRHAL